MSAGLGLSAELDPEIDKLGGTFIGDEMRLRQVMSNLVSNACKFSPSGSVKIVTKLLFPRTDSTGNTPVEEKHPELAQQPKAIEGVPDGTTNTQTTPPVMTPPESALSTDTEKTLNSPTDLQPVPVTVERLRQLREARDSTSSATRPYFGVRIPKKPAETKAIIRVEVHDTGVGLHKRDVIEWVLFAHFPKARGHCTDVFLQQSAFLAVCSDRDRPPPRW
jgi:signal transduction histidine kinase